VSFEKGYPNLGCREALGLDGVSMTTTEKKIYGVTFSELFKIDRVDAPRFAERYQEQAAKSHSHGPLVYIELTRRRIPRLKGLSRISYIGRSTGSFVDRYQNSRRYLERPINAFYYRHLLRSFQALTVYVYECRSEQDAKDLEGQLLAAYVSCHYELPPGNRAYGRGTEQVCDGLLSGKPATKLMVALKPSV